MTTRTQDAPDQAASNQAEALLPASCGVRVRLEVPRPDLDRVRACEALEGATRGSARSLRTVYFDTPAADLWRHDMVLRVRRTGRGWSMGLKRLSSGACTALAVPIGSAQPDVELFEPQVAQELRGLIGGAGLEPQFCTQVRRSTALLESGHTQIAVTFDDGHLVAGQARQPLSEVGLSLQRGEPAELFDLARQLARQAPLKLNPLGMSARGFALLAGTKPQPVKASEVDLDPEATLDTAIETIIAASLDHFTRNLPALHSDEPEALHQMRVALRRLRTALAQFDRALPCPAFAEFRDHAGELATALGNAREWDTFIEQVQACAPVQAIDGFAELLTAAGERRLHAYAAAAARLDGSETSRFVMALQGFVARRGWRNGLSAEELPRLTQPVSAFATAEMQRLRGRVLRRGKTLLRTSPEQRHRVRIALKNFRYAGEFFGSVMSGTGAAGQVHAAARLQTALGNFNDAVAIVELTQRLSQDVAPGALRATGFLEGWFGRSAAAGDAHLRKLWKRFRTAKLGGT